VKKDRNEAWMNFHVRHKNILVESSVPSDQGVKVCLGNGREAEDMKKDGNEAWMNFMSDKNILVESFFFLLEIWTILCRESL